MFGTNSLIPGSRIVCVHWTDITTISGWQAPMDAMKEELLQCWTTGLLLEETKILVRIACSWMSDGRVDDVVAIPVGVIVKIYDVEELMKR